MVGANEILLRIWQLVIIYICKTLHLYNILASQKQITDNTRGEHNQVSKSISLQNYDILRKNQIKFNYYVSKPKSG